MGRVCGLTLKSQVCDESVRIIGSSLLFLYPFSQKNKGGWYNARKKK